MKNKVGMYGGKFLIPHLGHLKCIIEASTLVDELYIVLSHDKINEKQYFKNTLINPIQYVQRLRWLKQLTKDIDNVKVIEVPEVYNEYESYFNPIGFAHREYDWKASAEKIKEAINKPIDTVFFGGDYEESFWADLYPESKTLHKFPRTNTDISATKIRTEGPYKHWDSIPNIVKPYFVKKICIIGTESCGKTQIVNKLALAYNTNQVKEYGRDVCEEVGGANCLQLDDYKKILCGQIILEEEAIKNSNKLLFIDSEQIVTSYYIDLYSKSTECVNKYINTRRLARCISNIQNYDLIILMSPSVDWVDDGTRLHGETHMRNKNHKELKKLLMRSDIEYIEIDSDNYNTRYNQCKNLIDVYLKDCKF